MKMRLRVYSIIKKHDELNLKFWAFIVLYDCEKVELQLFHLLYF